MPTRSTTVPTAEAALDDPEAVAAAAGLRYVHDTEPGISRHRAGRGFTYRSATGTRITDPKTIARVKALVIPPAWADVWVCTRADGHLQATGWDARSRKQYRYHPDWRAFRDQAKFDRLLDFGLVLPVLRRQVQEDLAARGLPRHKVLAAVVDLLDRTLIRVGNEEYAQANESYGLTTLRDDHADIRGGHVTFCFRGKGGHVREQRVTDRRLARIVKQCQDVPGQVLFQYLEGGEPHVVDSRDVNAYLQEVTGGPFTAKDFRTWAASAHVAAQLCEAPAAASATEAKRQAYAAVKSAAALLGNTPTVCRASYVHPAVLGAHAAGGLCGVAPREVRKVRATRPELDEDEVKLLVVLRQARQDQAGPAATRARAS